MLADGPRASRALLHLQVCHVFRTVHFWTPLRLHAPILTQENSDTQAPLAKFFSGPQTGTAPDGHSPRRAQPQTGTAPDGHSPRRAQPQTGPLLYACHGARASRLHPSPGASNANPLIYKGPIPPRVPPDTPGGTVLRVPASAHARGLALAWRPGLVTWQKAAPFLLDHPGPFQIFETNFWKSVDTRLL